MAKAKVFKKHKAKSKKSKAASSKRLAYKKSALIVGHAIRIHTTERLLGQKVTLGYVFPTFKARQLFRKQLHNLIGSSGFTIDLQHIPIKSHTTFDEVARALTVSALPGDREVNPPV